jgi:hypothetical protein
MRTDKKMVEVRKLLYIYYQHYGYPAGCVIKPNEFYTAKGVPAPHYGVMKTIHTELMMRQRIQLSLTEESYAAFEAIVASNRKNIFQLRDDIGYLLDRYQVKRVSAELAYSTTLMNASAYHASRVKAYRHIQTGMLMPNDRVTHFFVDYGYYVLDGISGTKYLKSHLTAEELHNAKPND